MARGVSPGSRVVTALTLRQRRATTSCAKARMNPSGLVVATAPARRQYSEFSLPCLGNYHWLRATQLLRLRAKIPPLMRPSPPLVSAKGAPTAHAYDLAPGAHPRPSALCRSTKGVGNLLFRLGRIATKSEPAYIQAIANCSECPFATILIV